MIQDEVVSIDSEARFVLQKSLRLIVVEEIVFAGFCC
jgi:hypothetical protein